jgi:hypothetical protein
MNKAAALIAVLWFSGAWAQETVGNIGSVRADYWTRFSQVELNVGLNAIPLFDVEVGLNLSTSQAHAAIGPRFEVLPRQTETGFGLKLVVLAAAWAELGSPVRFSGVGLIPGLEGTFWLSRRFGITGAVSVPVTIPYTEANGINGAGTQASPRVGLGLAF